MVVETIERVESGEETGEKENKPELDSDRYQIIDEKPLGEGTWGKVYRAKDLFSGNEVAVKLFTPTAIAIAQMRHRGLSPFEAVKKEAPKLVNCAYIVPRTFEKDNQGNLFVVMPVYNRFMSDIFSDNGNREHLSNGISLELLVKCLSDISSGLAEMHTKYRRAHGDLKLENLAVENRTSNFGFEEDTLLERSILLNDLGSSSIVSYNRSDSPRDNIGFIYTRAPENFEEKSHPTERSDVWGFGSLAYRLITGKYITEDELNNGSIEDITDKGIKRKIKQVPRVFRKFLEKCLKLDGYERFKNGTELKQGLRQVAERLNSKKYLKKQAKKVLSWSAGPTAVLGFLIYGVATHEPTELEIPKVRLHGPLYLSGKATEKPVEFVTENLSDLPDTVRNVPVLSVDERTIKLATNNRNVAALLKSHEQALRHLGILSAAPITEAQYGVYSAYTSVDEKVHNHFPREYLMVGKSIEVALSKSINSEGKVDLEDVCTIARVGEDRVNRARRATDSFEFKDYITARDSRGRYIIPKKEQRFIKQWIAYTHHLFY